MKNFWSYYAHKIKLSAEYLPFYFFSAIIEELEVKLTNVKCDKSW